MNCVNPFYFFHGFAANQIEGDSQFFDIAANNHGSRGTDLNDSEMFANLGYVTTKTPSDPSGPYDTCIRLPNLNFDYSIGEKLFIWWLGKITPEANERAFVGDGFGTSAAGTGQRGMHVRCHQTGKMTIATYGTTAKAGILSNAVPFDGAVHDIAVFLDGSNRTYGYWIDRQMDSAFGGGMLPYYPLDNFDTKNSNTFNLGSSSPAPGTGAIPQSGIASQTRALVILRFPAFYPSPNVSAISKACEALRVNPGKLLLMGAL